MEHTQKPALIVASEDRDMDTFFYAGIGARATPEPVLAEMTKLAGSLARTGWQLMSGGALGADTAFANGAPAGKKTIYLPWPRYNDHGGPDCRTLSHAALSACINIASKMHPAWSRCSPAVRKLHARNVAILLGDSLDRPVDAVVCWTEGGAITGGTGMALRIAAQYRIPVFNFSRLSGRQAFVHLLALSLQE